MIGYLLYPRGYCFGVKRIVDMTDQVLKLYKSVYVVEDIVHNKLFMNGVQARGVTKVQSIDDVPDGSAIMFSTRGIPSKMLKKADEKQLTVVDATCPIVKELQDAVLEKAETGYAIILIGNRTHQQIATLLGATDSDDMYVVYSDMDVDLLPDLSNKKVVYFTQTSLYSNDVAKIVNALVTKIPHIEVGQSGKADNICSETLDRQKVIAEIASTIDLLIVVGSLHSANAVSLVRTGEACNIKRVVCIDAPDAIQNDLLDNVEKFALISATSIDEATIKSVEDTLQNLAGIKYVIYPQSDTQIVSATQTVIGTQSASDNQPISNVQSTPDSKKALNS